MSYIMTPELAREANESIRKDRVDRYKKHGFSREDYEKEIVKGCNLAWEYSKAKSFALTCYREETGIKPAEKQQIEHKGNVVFEVIDYADKRNGKRNGKKKKRKGGNGPKN
jgi:hypothetical protein